jgi:aminoglycoside phosphotransferase (APT) family kinase protein
VPYANIPLTDDARRALRIHWGLIQDITPERLYGGEESVAYGIGDYVVRLGPTWRHPSEAEWCHSAATYASRRVPEAIAPIPAEGGATVVRVRDRPMSVWPLVRGVWPDASAPGMVAQSANLLARLHRALASLRPPPRPVPSALEFRADSDRLSTDPRLVDHQLDRWLAEYHRTNPYRQVVHGDYYPGNTLANRGALVAVLDWDDACVMAPEAEVASAAMEWSGGLSASITAMQSFARTYADAGGTAEMLDDQTLVQFTRHRLRCEAKCFDLARNRGTEFDEDDFAYHQARLASFKMLRP